VLYVTGRLPCSWQNADPCSTGCLPSLKPLLSLALKGTISTTENTAKSGASNTFHQNSKQSRSHLSSGTPIVSKGPSKVDDERPFARLDERDSDSFNGDEASGHELTDLRKNGITVTKAFKIDSNVARQH
jgi:hypothetical protein